MKRFWMMQFIVIAMVSAALGYEAMGLGLKLMNMNTDIALFAGVAVIICPLYLLFLVAGWAVDHYRKHQKKRGI